MKTTEELNALKNEVETMNIKRAELPDEELAQVSGGYIDPLVLRKPVEIIMDYGLATIRARITLNNFCVYFRYNNPPYAENILEQRAEFQEGEEITVSCTGNLRSYYVSFTVMGITQTIEIR